MIYTFKDYSDVSGMLITELDSIVELCKNPNTYMWRQAKKLISFCSRLCEN